MDFFSSYQTKMNISFIGSGNVAWHLAPALDNAGHVVKEVFSRNPRHAEALTDRLYQAEVKATLDFSTSPSRMFIVSVSDDALAEVAREVILPDEAILVHTSGSQSIDVLQYAAAAHTAVFYPLQTFTKSKKVDLRATPILIESSQDETLAILTDIARSISQRVQRIFPEERLALHVAAVFASNFTNHMLSISHQILQHQQLPKDLLAPLVRETFEKLQALSPTQAQTGPARRGDLETLDRHMEFLKDDPELAGLYKVVSQHIIDLYGE